MEQMRMRKRQRGDLEKRRSKKCERTNNAWQRRRLPRGRGGPVHKVEIISTLIKWQLGGLRWLIKSGTSENFSVLFAILLQKELKLWQFNELLSRPVMERMDWIRIWSIRGRDRRCLSRPQPCSNVPVVGLAALFHPTARAFRFYKYRH